jgi:hypothetical protein
VVQKGEGFEECRTAGNGCTRVEQAGRVKDSNRVAFKGPGESYLAG